MPEGTDRLRILHFSDIHVGWRSLPPRKWLGKRAVGALNLLAGRARRFVAAENKLAALAAFVRTERVDLVLFTGDYTALGLEEEFAVARRAVGPLFEAPAGYVGIPGNHDIYTFDVLRQGTFARYFGDTIRSEPRSLGGPQGWPMVRLVGEHVAVIALDSARPNPWPWRSSGRLPADQLAALTALLEDPRVGSRFVFVMNHYPPLLGDGRRDRPFHRLVNDRALLEACRRIRRGALLAGHVHHRYATPLPGADSAKLFCSGSATMDGREGLWCFELEAAGGRAIPGRWDGARYTLEPESAISV